MVNKGYRRKNVVPPHAGPPASAQSAMPVFDTVKIPQELRRQAEEILGLKATEESNDLSPVSVEDAQSMLHDLQVQQIELEMQNEELRRALAELDATRVRYFGLYDLAPVGYCTISAKGLILEANLKASTILGLARGALIRERLSRFILAEDQDIYYRLHRQLLKSFEPQSCELRMVQSEGAVFWVHLSATLAREKSGEPVSFVTLSDITERKRVESALTEEEEKYRKIFENQLVAVCVFDSKSFQFIDINETYIQLYGYSRKELTGGMTIYDLSVEQKSTATSFDFAHSQGSVFIPLRYHRKKDGTIFPVEIVGESIMLKGRPALFGMIKDITDRMDAEEELKNSKAFNLAILSSLSAEVAVLDAHGEIIAVNQAWQGFSLENSINPGVPTPHTQIGTNYLKICREVTGEKREDALKAINGIESVLEGGLQSFCMEYPCHSQDKERWFSMSVTPLNPRTRGAVVVHNDITGQKQAELALIKAHAELEHRVLERTAELEKTNATLVMMLDYARKVETDIEERVVANLRINNLQLLHGLRKNELSQGALDILKIG